MKQKLSHCRGMSWVLGMSYVTRAISIMRLAVGGETMHFISAALSSALFEVTPLHPKFNNDLSEIYW